MTSLPASTFLSVLVYRYLQENLDDFETFARYVSE
jgi:uncharacterized protein YutE (UPF0331/DUF86 family)